jgi:hypothetical protein
MTTPDQSASMARRGRAVRRAALTASGLTVALMLVLALAGQMAPTNAGGAPLTVAPTDGTAAFTSAYVASSVAWQHPSANVYDYGTLLSGNAAAHYVPRSVDPFTGTPAVLVVLYPLTRLPFALAVAVWRALSLLCLLVAAYLLSALFTHAVTLTAGRGRASASSRRRALDVLLAASAVRLGAYAFPVLPFAVSLIALVCAAPIWSLGGLWSVSGLPALCGLLLSVLAWLSGRATLAALALAAAVSLNPWLVVFLLLFLALGAWETVSVVVAAIAALMALPLLFFPAWYYTQELVVTLAYDHLLVGTPRNESLLAVAIHSMEFLGHAFADDFAWVLLLLNVVRSVLALLTLVGVLLIPLVAARVGTAPPAPFPLSPLQDERRTAATRSALSAAASAAAVTSASAGASAAAQRLKRIEGLSDSGMDILWLGCVVLLTAVMLLIPLATASSYVLVLPALLMLGAWPLLRVRGEHGARVGWTKGDSGIVAVAIVAFLLVGTAWPVGMGAGTPAPKQLVQVFLMLRPLGAGLAWCVALSALVATLDSRGLLPPTWSPSAWRVQALRGPTALAATLQRALRPTRMAPHTANAPSVPRVPEAPNAGDSSSAPPTAT